ncbi:Wzz/FepE/Etk N-terminal domain-containing protein [Roseateles sp.]|uniref:Wzz/FepE/Etk N-terminal domain-containing protein n=1 Tax=Roseateles sp. TaxID=1971397 RepID=UPI002F40BE50
MNDPVTPHGQAPITPGSPAQPVTALLLPHWKRIAGTALATGVVAFGITFLIPPTYTSRTSFISPQQQSSAVAAMASLGALANLASGASSIKNQAEQFVSLLQSATISDILIDRHTLMEVYDVKYRSAARKKLAENVRIAAGKKDGLIYIEVDDTSAQRAADMANLYVAELRKMTSSLALTEAQQRRVFFESQLKLARDRLKTAQLKLQDSGFSVGDLKAEPKAAAESFARLKAEQTSLQVRLRALQSRLADNAPEIQQLRATLSGTDAALARLEASGNGSEESRVSYVSRYRDYKYEEALFEIFARQYELARSDESRDGALIQIIDVAQPADRRTRPKRVFTAIGATVAGAFAAIAFFYIRARRRSPSNAQ